MLSMEELRGLFGRKVVGRDGGSLGEIDQLYADRDDGQPTFATVHTSAAQKYFVPLDGARMEGEIVTLAYDVATVTSAPGKPSGGELSEEEESRLYKHYGMSGPAQAGTTLEERELELGHPAGMAGADNEEIATDHPTGMAGTEGAPSWPAPHEAGMAGQEPYPAEHPAGMAGHVTLPKSRLRRWTAEPAGSERHLRATGTAGAAGTTDTGTLGTTGTTTTRRDTDRL